jgi:DNA (cytosine-5)-methyltransferase 1
MNDTLNRPSAAVLPYHPALRNRESERQTGKTPGLSFYEFFCGGGMARAGLGPKWDCLFANDFDFKKSAVYTENWGAGVLKTKDVGKLEISDLPGQASLAWASFPCQDLSLAGMGAGLRGDRSGTFWPFWGLMKSLDQDNRAPHLIVLENVCGTLTSHGGKDFTAISNALAAADYKFGAIIVNAAEFVPQSRPRLFIIAVAASTVIPAALTDSAANARHSAALRAAHERLPAAVQNRWIWWKVPQAPKRMKRFADLVEDSPASVQWHTREETAVLLRMMSPLNRKKVAAVKKTGKLVVGTIYKRTRKNEHGVKVQRAEVRFDDIAGCLRTSTGGSSRQLILVVKGKSVRSRLLSSREAARLMGLPDSYKLPPSYNEAYHLIGDGVVVNVVRHIAANLLEAILAAQPSKIRVSA